MSTPSLVKQPSESRLYSMDFSALLAAGESIASVTSFTAATPPDAAALTISAIAASGPYAQARIAGGTAAFRYTVTAVVLTSLGNTLEGEGLLQVRNL